jgi:hypothetical protein
VYITYFDIKNLACTVCKSFVIILTTHDDFFPRMSWATIICNIIKNLRIKFKVQTLHKPRLYSGPVYLFILESVCTFIRCLVTLFYVQHVYSSWPSCKLPLQYLEAYIVILIVGEVTFFFCLLK